MIVGSLYTTYSMTLWFSYLIVLLSSAVTDQKFTENVKIKNLSYYNACNQAEEEMGVIDANLAKAYASCESEGAYFAEV